MAMVYTGEGTVCGRSKPALSGHSNGDFIVRGQRNDRSSIVQGNRNNGSHHNQTEKLQLSQPHCQATWPTTTPRP